LAYRALRSRYRTVPAFPLPAPCRRPLLACQCPRNPVHALPSALRVMGLVHDHLFRGSWRQAITLAVKAIGGSGIVPVSRVLILHGGCGALADQPRFHLSEADQHGEQYPAHRGRGCHRLPAVIDHMHADPGLIPHLHQGQTINRRATRTFERHHHYMLGLASHQRPQQRRPARPGGQRSSCGVPCITDIIDERQRRHGAICPHPHLSGGQGDAFFDLFLG
jgi:hypothetical protein